MTETQRPIFEDAVVERLMESGFLEIEIRTESLARCDDGYQDEVINAGWHYWNAAIAANLKPEPHVDPALIGIAEEMKESGGHWQPCSGCYDTEDGHPTQKYDFSPALQTSIGCGCHECGGLGAVWWHMTDEQVADFVRICEEVDTEHQLEMRIVRLEAGLRRFRRAYVNLMETGRDRIISLGGSCDPVDVMEAGDPELRLIDVALAEGQRT